MRHAKNAFALFIFLTVAAGCASLGNEKADTFNDKFAYAVGIHHAVVDATQSALDAGTISADDARSVSVQAHNARTVLDTAKAAADAGDAAGAQSKLVIALTALTALQEYLRAHGEAQ